MHVTCTSKVNDPSTEAWNARQKFWSTHAFFITQKKQYVIIHVYFWNRYKKGPNSFKQILSKWRLANFVKPNANFALSNFVSNYANNRNLAEFSTEQKNIPPPAPEKRPVTRLWRYNDYVNYADRLASFKDWPKFLKGPNKKIWQEPVLFTHK